MDTSDFDYRLPPGLIAQTPAGHRDESRLMVVRRRTADIEHRIFRELPEILAPGDLLVLNDARVIPARLHGVREETGGRVEVLFLHEEGPGRWLALTRSGGKMRPGERISFGPGQPSARLVERRGSDGDLLEVRSAAGAALEAGALLAFLDERGRLPLPPYIRRPPHPAGGPAGPDDVEALDRERYQTVYASRPGAVAAPTAGLHFTAEVFAELERRGVRRTALTLLVGPGTFQPVKSGKIEDHRMGSERFELGPAAAAAVNAARAAGTRVVAVGTTSARTLESRAAADGSLSPGEGWTDLFIRPPYRFRTVDALVTNFHLPRSTLIMLVSAFAGRELVMEAYRRAVEAGYRFYSYGDCCLFLE